MLMTEIFPPATVDDAISYANQIASGEIVSCADVRNQCKMFVEDYSVRQKSADFRWTFDHRKARHILAYVQLLSFVEGTVAGTPIRLSDWQAFILACAYGWVDKQDDTLRRYTRIICQVARKNSKSTLLATLSIYELVYGPTGSQIVSMATQREQSKLVWSMAKRMIERSDSRLTADVNITTSAISNREKWNRYTPLSKESKRLDGLNIRLAIADESAAISDPNLFEVITSSMGSQKSPQFWHITTAQAGAESNYYFSQLDYAKKVLEGIIKDERILCMAYALDADDEWDDETKWVKANPNLGKSVSLEFLREECAIAKEIPSARANFFIKYLNKFISTSTSWIELEKWNKNIVEELKTDLPMYVGLDLGSTSDLTAVSQVWAEDGVFYFSAKCFVPEEAFKSAPKHVRQIYDIGVENGTLIVTEGEVADHKVIREHIESLNKDFDLREVAFDSWNASQITSLLQEAGLNMVKYSQGMSSMSPAAKDAEMMIKSATLKHLDDPFLAWQVSNCDVYSDINGNIKVRKGSDPALKVDAIIAMIMAIGRATAHGAHHKKPSFNFFFVGPESNNDF
jgi:phage terminase large subunit-like protein